MHVSVCRAAFGLTGEDASRLRDVTSVFVRLLTAALRAEVLLQSCYVSVPAQSVNVSRVWGPAEELKGFLVGLGGAEPGQVAARGEVVIQGRRQRGLLTYVQQEAKVKGCRNKRANIRRALPSELRQPEENTNNSTSRPRPDSEQGMTGALGVTGEAVSATVEQQVKAQPKSCRLNDTSPNITDSFDTTENTKRSHSHFSPLSNLLAVQRRAAFEGCLRADVTFQRCL